MYGHRTPKKDCPHRCHACQVCGKILGWCKCFDVEHAEVEFDGTCAGCIDDKSVNKGVV